MTNWPGISDYTMRQPARDSRGCRHAIPSAPAIFHRLKTGVVTATINRELATFIRHPIGYTGSGARENYGASNARVSDRYNIVSPADLQDTAQMCDGHSGHNAPPRLTLPS
jgi:hypothetical protein